MKIEQLLEIKLSGMSGSPSLVAFIDEFMESTAAHPFDNRARVFDGSVSLEIYPFNNAIHISDITTLRPRSGAGTKAMKFLIELANKHRVKLELGAKAYSGQPQHITDTVDLVKWYMRLGFRIDDDLVSTPDDIEDDDVVDMIYIPR